MDINSGDVGGGNGNAVVGDAAAAAAVADTDVAIVGVGAAIGAGVKSIVAVWLDAVTVGCIPEPEIGV